MNGSSDYCNCTDGYRGKLCEHQVLYFFLYCIHSSQIYYRIIVRILPVRMGEPANPLMRISNAIARLAIWVSFCSGFLKLMK